jgi:hypothetical protein
VSFDVVERLAHRGKKKVEPPAPKPVPRPTAVA